MEDERQNLKISGAESAGGGKYNEVQASGSGSIRGDVDCNLMKLSGASSVKGNITSKDIVLSGATDIKEDVKSNTLKASGGTNIRGNVEAEELSMSGSSDVRGNITSKKISLSGGAEVKGNLYGEEIKISGASEVKKDCECESFTSKGSISIGGLLNAENINIFLHGKCKAREIGGDTINIRYCYDNQSVMTKMLKDLFTNKKELITDVIEGDNIYIEGTKANIVRGKNITIGQDCHIGRVEYKEEINILSNAIVEEKVSM